jgi:hypothetical protein
MGILQLAWKIEDYTCHGKIGGIYLSWEGRKLYLSWENGERVGEPDIGDLILHIQQEQHMKPNPSY